MVTPKRGVSYLIAISPRLAAGQPQPQGWDCGLFSQAPGALSLLSRHQLDAPVLGAAFRGVIWRDEVCLAKALRN